MSERDDVQERRRALKAAYLGLYDQIADILFQHDPIGINFDNNTNEYEPEVDTILPRLAQAQHAADVRRIIHEELIRWFSSQDAGSEETYSALAEEVWEAYQRYRAAC